LGINRVLTHDNIKYRDSDSAVNGWTSWDTPWDAGWVGFREHVLHGDIDAATGRGTFGVSGHWKAL